MNKQESINRIIAKAREVMRYKQMAYKTEQSYIHWIERYSWWLFDHAAGSHEDKLRGYLSDLANKNNVAANTQRQALNALVFLYRHILGVEIGEIGTFSKSRKPRRLPTVLSTTEIQQLLRPSPANNGSSAPCSTGPACA